MGIFGEERGLRTRQKMERLVAGPRWVDGGHVFATTIGTPIEAGAATGPSRGRWSERGYPTAASTTSVTPPVTYLLAQGFTLE